MFQCPDRPFLPQQRLQSHGNLQQATTSYFQQALMIYPELFRDNYCRDVLKQTKKSLVKQAKAGRLRVNGRYRFVSPDLYAFCEWLFLDEINPKGLLEDGEVYVNEFRHLSYQIMFEAFDN